MPSRATVQTATPSAASRRQGSKFVRDLALRQVATALGPVAMTGASSLASFDAPSQNYAVPVMTGFGVDSIRNEEHERIHWAGEYELPG